MKRFAALVLIPLMVLCANAAQRKVCELVAFDYSELALETKNSVRIAWSGTVESYLTYNSDCRVVMTLTMDGGKDHEFATVPFTVTGLGQVEVSDEFIVPRQLWAEATDIAVEAQDASAKAIAAREAESRASARPSEELDPLEECTRQTTADKAAFLYLRNEIASTKEELSELETELMISSGLLRKENVSPRVVKRQQGRMQELEAELEKRLEQLRVNIERYCRDQQ